MSQSVEIRGGLHDQESGEGVPMGVRCVVLFAVLVFANLPAIAFAQSSSCRGIHVKVLNIRNSTGTVDARFSNRQGVSLGSFCSRRRML